MATTVREEATGANEDERIPTPGAQRKAPFRRASLQVASGRRAARSPVERETTSDSVRQALARAGQEPRELGAFRIAACLRPALGD